jgi:MFS-type transporter involved in bile tolerance (Atg22 family)
MIGQALTIVSAVLLWTQHEGLVFVLAAIGLVLGFGITFVAVKEPPIEPAEATKRVAFRPGTYLRGLFAQREAVKYLCATFFFWLGVGGVLPFVTRFGVQALKLTESMSFTLLLPALVGTAAAAVPASLIAARIGKKPVLAAGLIFFGIATLGSALVAQTYVEAMAAMFLLGVCNGICNALMFPMFSELIPGSRAGELTGLSSTVWSLAQPVGAFAAGLLADSSGNIRGAFACAGAALVVSFILLLTVRAPHHQTVAVAEPLPDAVPA